MPLSRFKRVLILCPTSVTGGPEALHQLGYALGRIGVDCTIAYAGAENRLRILEDKVLCATPENRLCMEQYADYAPRVAADIPLDAETLVVIPEIWAVEMRAVFAKATLAVWWLSIDNAFVRQPELRDAETCRRLLTSERIVHLYQSAYARDWLLGQGLEGPLELGDYTTDLFIEQPADRPSPRPLVAYNPAKGGNAAQQLFAAMPQYDALALQGLSKAQLRDVFDERLLYVDLGGFPGKDRMPREAAMSGSVVFIRRHGAGARRDDFALPDAYKISVEDVRSGTLRARLQAVVDDPVAHWDRQAEFRAGIAAEKAHFFETVARLWGREAATPEPSISAADS